MSTRQPHAQAQAAHPTDGERPAAPLAGFTVGVTADRRAEEQGTALQRRGAEVIYGAALRMIPLSDDSQLVAASRELAARPADIVVATTGVGFRSWMETCESWDLAEALLAGMAKARLLARGPKTTGAIRATGLREEWSPPSESSPEVLDYLLDQGVAGARIALQLHGEGLPDFCAALRRGGAEVVEVPVYRWSGPRDVAPLDRVIGAVVAADVDAVTFTSAPAVSGTLDRAKRIGREWQLETALRKHVLAMSVGPVTAQPLLDREIPTVWPERSRIGAQINRLGVELAARSPLHTIAGHQLQIRGHAVLLDGQLRQVSPASMRLLRELARTPGRFRTHEELSGVLDAEGSGDPHTVTEVVARLGKELAETSIVETVTSRGYRLAVAPGEDASEQVREP